MTVDRDNSKLKIKNSLDNHDKSKIYELRFDYA